jgi:hypothetical protein
MGHAQSVDTSLVKQNALIREIHKISQELSRNYTTNFIDPDFCNRLALIYNDKLIRYRKQELDGISYTLGIVTDVPLTKKKTCDAIIKHYTDRLNLISGIQYSLSYVSDRIFALTTGPRCDGNPEVFEMNECQKSGGTWQNYIVMPDQRVKENVSWFNHLENMQSNYLSSLRQLLVILRQLQDFDNDIDNERLKIMSNRAKSIIENMQQHAYQMYKLILTTKTMSKEELTAFKEKNKIERKSNAARLAALAESTGLPTR